MLFFFFFFCQKSPCTAVKYSIWLLKQSSLGTITCLQPQTELSFYVDRRHLFTHLAEWHWKDITETCSLGIFTRLNLTATVVSTDILLCHYNLTNTFEIWLCLCLISCSPWPKKPSSDSDITTVLLVNNLPSL